MKSKVRAILSISLCSVLQIAIAEGIALPEIAKQVRPATVLLSVSNCNGKLIGTGTGFLISADGLIVTNNHVIQGGCEISVKLETGVTYTVAGTVARNSKSDIALLKINGAKLPYVKFGDAGATEVGQQIAVIGNPLGLEGSLSEGVIAAKRDFEGQRWLQITAAISPGSSGSPVVNSAGEVVGIATLLFRGGQSLNLAVPADVAQSMVSQSTSQPKLVPLAESAKEMSDEDRNLLRDPEFSEVFDVVEKDDHARAIAMLQSLISKHPSNWQLKAMLIAQYEAVGFYDKVEAYLQQEIQSNPSKYSNWERLGDVYKEQRKYELAAEAYRQAVVCFERENTSKPVDGFGLWAAGELYRKIGNTKKSQEFFARFEELKRSDKLRNPFEIPRK